MTRLLLALSSVFAGVNALWPAPHSLEQGESFLRLSPSFTFDLHCSLSSHPPADLLGAVDEAYTFLRDDNQQALIVGRGETYRPAVISSPVLHSLALKLPSFKDCASLVMTPSSISEEARRPLEEREEHYCMDISEDGSEAVLSARTTLGLFRGLNAFTQIVYILPASRRERSEQLVLRDQEPIRYLRAPLHIEDRPAFPWRGLLLDTSRNFIPVDAIKRLIRTASWTHFNQFHWHATDSHSWPLEIPGMPELIETGAYDSRSIYTPDDVNDITRYANIHGIDVMLEIDMPGHTGIIGESHPNHIACHFRQPWTRYANEPGAGQLRIASAKTIEFARRLLDSVLSLTAGSYFSTGGDEINEPCYEDDEATQASLARSGKTLSASLHDFHESIHDVVRRRGKTPLVWEELVTRQKLNLGEDTLVAVWRPGKTATEAVAQGYRIVHATADHFYLDCGIGGWLGGKLGDKHDGRSWCEPYKGWHHIYAFDPFDAIPDDKRKLVMGGQVAAWSEQIDETNLEQIFWPRAAAAAEVFWTGQAKERDANEALPRLHDLRERMRRRGVKAVPLQPFWCALRPGECDAL